MLRPTWRTAPVPAQRVQRWGLVPGWHPDPWQDEQVVRLRMVTGFVAGDPSSVYLVGMWVAPELRGTEAARDLVGRVVEWARARGSERVLLSVERDNGRAARLYEKCGFVELDEMPPFPYEPNPGNRFYEFRL